MRGRGGGDGGEEEEEGSRSCSESESESHELFEMALPHELMPESVEGLDSEHETGL